MQVFSCHNFFTEATPFCVCYFSNSENDQALSNIFKKFDFALRLRPSMVFEQCWKYITVLNIFSAKISHHVNKEQGLNT